MKRIQLYFLIIGVGFLFFPNGLVLAQDQKTSSDPVEVVIQGKQYKSIRAYKRNQIKETLERALSSYNLREFSEDELSEIINDVRKQQTKDRPTEKGLKSNSQQVKDSSRIQRTVESEETDPSISQMQELIENYQKQHKNAGQLLIDPGKVKDIII